MSERARGVYRYWRDNARQAVEEPWTIGIDGAGWRLAGERQVDGRAVLRVEAHYRQGGCQAMALHWEGEGGPLRVHYRRDQQSLLWWRDNETPSRLTLPANCQLFPLLRAATGPLLPWLAGGRRTLALPDLHEPGTARFLAPRLSERHATGGPEQFRYFGGEYGEAGSDYWLDPQGLVERYRWTAPDGLWEVHLEETRIDPAFDAAQLLSERSAPATAR
mgnify:CR=1 FL=1